MAPGNKISGLIDHPGWESIDRHFARFIAGRAGTDDAAILLAALLASRRSAEGDICVDLNELGGVRLDDVLGEPGGANTAVSCPETREWIEALRATDVVGAPGDYAPLVLDGSGRLYLHRLWHDERIIAESIRARLAAPPPTVDEGLLRDGLERILPAEDGGLEWQRIAALSAVTRAFTVISGGPGTGKTSTVVRILALVIEQAIAGGLRPLIALAAPTGRAAARLKGSVRASVEGLACDAAVRAHMPVEAMTVHRLLGSRGDGSYRFTRENPLPHHAVVIDESSMADCGLMARIFEAVPTSSRLILIGDRDQLASVEAGAVLGDICDTGREHGYSAGFVERAASFLRAEARTLRSGSEPPIADSLVVLRKSYRFDEGGGIGAVSRAVRTGDARRALALIEADRTGAVSFIGDARLSDRPEPFAERAAGGYAPYLTAAAPGSMLEAFSRFAVLCALRNGSAGSLRINAVIERALYQRGLIEPDDEWYHGRPIVVVRNSSSARLYNGDSGIALRGAGADDGAAIAFAGSEGEVRFVPPLKLPEHETAYATTVHKAQGSEFDEVLFVLPERPARVLTRELVYTALSRARRRIEIWGSPEVLAAAIDNPTRRKSGLNEMLWG